jgi:hypothetical protein
MQAFPEQDKKTCLVQIILNRLYGEKKKLKLAAK